MQVDSDGFNLLQQHKNNRILQLICFPVKFSLII